MQRHTDPAHSATIGSITLEAVLPVVFKGEPRRDSGVWLTDLRLERGRFYQVEAASGAGKSSLCAYIYGQRTDYEGRLLLGGTDARTLTPPRWQALRRRHLAYLPQELGLFGELTALENIRLKNALTGHATEEQIAAWLEMMGIADRAGWPAGRLSVGQRQRVALIRALCQPFDFILLDEPVSHLDERNNRIAARMVADEARRQGAGIISTSVGNPLLLPDVVVVRL